MAEGKAVWWRVSGIPLHICNPDTLHCIAASFGSLKKIDKTTLDRERFSYTSLLVEVDEEQDIPQQVTARLGGRRFVLSIGSEIRAVVGRGRGRLVWAEVVAAYKKYRRGKQEAVSAGEKTQPKEAGQSLSGSLPGPSGAGEWSRPITQVSCEPGEDLCSTNPLSLFRVKRSDPEVPRDNNLGHLEKELAAAQEVGGGHSPEDPPRSVFPPWRMAVNKVKGTIVSGGKYIQCRVSQDSTRPNLALPPFA